MKQHLFKQSIKLFHISLMSFLLMFGFLMVSCNSEPAVIPTQTSTPTPSPEPAPKDEVWQVGDKTYESLQEAIDDLSNIEAKSFESEYYTVKLLKDNVEGPGAVITKTPVIIDFNGHGYDVTGDYGLLVSGTADVILTNSSTESEAKVTLKDEEAGLVLIDVDGTDATVTVICSTNLSVGTDQYVFKVDNGATFTAGSADSDRVKLNGLMAAKGGASAEITRYTTAKTAKISVAENDTVVTLRTRKISNNNDNELETGRVDITDIVRLDDSNAKVVIASTGNSRSVIIGVQQPDCVEIALTASSYSYLFSSYSISYEIYGASWAWHYSYEKYKPITIYQPYTAGNVTLPPTYYLTAKNSGLTLAGWNEKPDFSDESVFSFSKNTTGNKVFYAKWVYTITYNKNNKTEWDVTGVVPPDQTEIDGWDVTLATKNTLAKSNHTFVGWNTASDGSGAHYDAETTVSGGFGGNITLYAQWRENPTVTVKEGTGISSVSGGGRYAPGTQVTINAVVSDGYSWSKWTQTSGGADVSAVQNYSFTMEGFDNISYTANATPNNYTVRFYSNYDENDDEYVEKTQTYNSNYVLPIKPTRESYVFAGWFTQRNGGTQITDTNTFTNTEDQNLYAHWIQETVTIVFNVNGGSGTDYEQVLPRGTRTYIDSISNMSIVAPADTVFAGWTTAEDGSGDYYCDNDEVSFPVETVTLYAQWGLDLNDDSIVPDKATWNNNTYVVTTDMTLEDNRIIATGDVKLFLLKDTTLTASKGIGVHYGNSLTIQGKGTLTANADNDNAAIGGTSEIYALALNINNVVYHCGTITINGGIINATGGSYGSGIGEPNGSNWRPTETNHHPNSNPVFSIAINGGTVSANGGASAPGIGAGADGVLSPNGTLTISGGTVTAIAGVYSSGEGNGVAGIGGGMETGGIAVTIKGGTVIAHGRGNNRAISGCEHTDWKNKVSHGSLRLNPFAGTKLTLYKNVNSTTGIDYPYTPSGTLCNEDDKSSYMRIETTIL